MRISFLPRYDRSAASSRLRVFALVDAINKMGEHQAIVGRSGTEDVLIIQKSVDSKIAREQRKSRPVFYDFDDEMPDWVFLEFDQIVDAWITDTPEKQREYERKGLSKKPCYVLRDSLDYGLTEPLPLVPATKSVVWFGNWPNAKSVVWMAEVLPESFGFGLISTAEAKRFFNRTNLVFVPWNLETFSADLRRGGMCLLSHCEDGTGKSENKLVTAIAHGVPAIVSWGSPSYERLMRLLGLYQYIATDEEAFLQAVDDLMNPVYREQYMECQRFVFERYKPEAVAADLLNIIASHAR